MFDISVRKRLPTVCQKNRDAPHVTAEARAVHDVGDVVDQRLQQAAVLARVVLQIGVLDDAVGQGDVLARGLDGGALAAVDLVKEHLDACIEAGNLIAHMVSGAVL